MFLFSRKKKAPLATESISKIRESMETLQKRQCYLEKKVEMEKEVAKKNATKNKKAAIMALKRKKQYEQQIERLLGAQMTLESQLMAIEGANVNLEALKAMQQGSRTMKTITQGMTLNEVDDTMEDIQEQMDIVNEVGEALSQGLGQQYDEDELLDELDTLEQEELDQKLLTELPSSSLPKVPTKAPGTGMEMTEEEKELEALTSSMQ
ncbi:charged multivesicular body protein 4c-like isoform X2 [Zophobas morio]|uniref:charged multivesicular body protein 4c-like isoform X2 n=1 Tax=Zophobas morio TaxID=2755281 RepID=UPI0030836A1C